MPYIIIFVLAIVLVVKNSQFNKLIKQKNKLWKELQDLKAKYNIEEVPREENVIEAAKPVKTEEQIIVEKVEQKESINEQFEKQAHEELKKEKPVRDEKGTRNVAILVTGAICIVLSAIVFLMSTWQTIPDLLKTVILVLLTAVFLGGSYIAKQKFKLDKTSQTFFYIAMAYIPICLISISIFGLLGQYLSILGEGRFIYLMGSGMLVAILYYYISVSKSNKYMLYGSILSQIFSIVMFSLIFSNDIIIIGISLLLYNLLLILLTKKDIFIKIYNIIPVIAILIVVSQLIAQSNLMIFMILLLAINYLILEIKNSNLIYSYIFNISGVALGIYTVILYKGVLGVDLYMSSLIGWVLTVYVIEFGLLSLYGKDKKNLSNSLLVVTILAMGMLFFESLTYDSIVEPYMISALQVLLLAVTYMKSEKVGKILTAILIPFYFITTGIEVISSLALSYHAYIVFAIITFGISEIFRKRVEILHKSFFIVSHIFIVLTYLGALIYSWGDFTNDVIYLLLLMMVYVYSYIVQKTTIFKYLTYITSNFVLASAVNFFMNNSEIIYYIPMITTLAIMYIEAVYKKLEDTGSSAYLVVSTIIAFGFIGIAIVDTEVSTIVAIIFAIAIIAYNLKNKEDVWNIVPLVCVMPAIFGNKFNQELSLGLMIMSLVAVSGGSLLRKKTSVFTVFSGIYLALTAANVNNSYLSEILFIAWSVSHFYLIKEKYNELFKFLVYVSLLLLYNNIIADLGINTYTAISMLRIYCSCNANNKDNINKTCGKC